MGITCYGNIIEGFFWIAISLFFFFPLIKRGEQHRLFCFYGWFTFFIFGLSDFYEAHTGAWWRPWWLLAWKVACNLGFIGILLWYTKIMGSFKNVLAKWNTPAFHRNKPDKT